MKQRKTVISKMDFLLISLNYYLDFSHKNFKNCHSNILKKKNQFKKLALKTY